MLTEPGSKGAHPWSNLQRVQIRAQERLASVADRRKLNDLPREKIGRDDWPISPRDWHALQFDTALSRSI
jgi:hypothetical protein